MTGIALIEHPSNVGLSIKRPRSTTRKLSYILFVLTSILFVFLYLDVPKTVQNIKIARNLYLIYNVPDKKEHKINDVYVILSGDMNYHYLLATPFVVQHWLNLNVSSIVMLCGKQEDYENDPAGKEVIDELDRLQAVVMYLQNHTLNSNNFAQNMRNYAAATEFVQENLNNKTILMTSDVDFYPFHKEHHIPEVSKGKEIYFYNINCCGNQEWKGLKYQQFVMITIAMTVKRWKEVMEIGACDRATGEYIEEKTNATFDNELNKQLNDKDWMWYLDQRLFGLRYYYANKTHDYTPLISTYNYRKRLDRSVWKSYTKRKFENMDFSRVDDAHTSPAIYTEEWWGRNLPFYKRIFTSEQLNKLTEYRNRAVKYVDEKATAKRHFHP